MNPNSEYNDFMREPQKTLSTSVKVKSDVMAIISQDLRFYYWHIIGKIILIHFVIGALTLFICPQFGVGPFAGRFGLDAFFMKFGHTACACLCGALFMGISSLCLLVILKPGETLFLKKHKYSLFSGLALSSLAIFLILAGFMNSEWVISLEYSSLWLTAAIVGSTTMASLEKIAKTF